MSTNVCSIFSIETGRHNTFQEDYEKQILLKLKMDVIDYLCIQCYLKVYVAYFFMLRNI